MKRLWMVLVFLVGCSGTSIFDPVITEEEVRGPFTLYMPDGTPVEMWEHFLPNVEEFCGRGAHACADVYMDEDLKPIPGMPCHTYYSPLDYEAHKEHENRHCTEGIWRGHDFGNKKKKLPLPIGTMLPGK